MFFGLIASVLGLFFEPLGALFLYLCLPLLLYFEKAVNFFGGMQVFLRIDNFPVQFTIAYYLLLISFLLFRIQKK